MELVLLELDRLRAERRAFASDEIRLEEDPTPKLRGHAAVFDQETELFPGYREVIRRGAFKATLRAPERPQMALWNHDAGRSLAIVGGKPPLRLWEDDRGLGFEFEIPMDVSDGRDLLARMRRGLVRGASFGFRVVKAPETLSEGVFLREIQEVDLWEVSPVSFPQYVGTDVAVKSRDAVRRRLAELEARALTDPELRRMIEGAPAELRPPARPLRREARAREIAGRL